MLISLALLICLQVLSDVQERWDRVWSAVHAPAVVSEARTPEAAFRAGPPVRVGRDVVFRFEAPTGTKLVYLAGTFNGYAENSNGRVSDPKYLMSRSVGQIWWSSIRVSSGIVKYKFVTESEAGVQAWTSDPFVPAKDSDSNSVFDLNSIPIRHDDTSSIVWPGDLKPTRRDSRGELQKLSLRVQKVWTKPAESNTISADLAGFQGSGLKLALTVTTPFGERILSSESPVTRSVCLIPIAGLSKTGGFVAHVQLLRGAQALAEGDVPLTVADRIGDDVRYGFYSQFMNHHGDYDAKANLLAAVGVNAVEFFDYFKVHGLYAPTEPAFSTELFGEKVDALDIQPKIDAGHRRNIDSMAYVAAYAASESVYRAHPDPMTDERGVPRIFNGSLMPEDQADREHKPKWLWIMDISRGSQWRNFVMRQFERAIDGDPGVLVSFDGFEVDTYGDPSQTRFYAKGSKQSGELLSTVLHDFVGCVKTLTHRIKPDGLVTFNGVNEFAEDNMLDANDFLFMEIWRGHTDRLEGLVDIVYSRRSRLNQRVVLKVYPSDMDPARTSWSPNSLRRVLGATITGGGSLEVVGDPDEKAGVPHALNTLYYPDNQPQPVEDTEILRAYNRHDAMLFGYTHGSDVYNVDSYPFLEGCLVRCFAAPARHVLTYQILRTGEEDRWSVETAPLPPAKNMEIVWDLPAAVAPSSVWYCSPDSPSLRLPMQIDFQVVGSKLRVRLPELSVLGALILRY